MKLMVICAVGHENWGKSETLYYLVGESRHKAWIVINGIDIFVRHMLNDDRPDDFIDFINALEIENKPYVVAALCPNFTTSDAQTENILKTLRGKGYKLYFWVLHNQYGFSATISAEEITRLQRHGEVEVYRRKGEAQERAKALRTYISKMINA